MPVAAPDGNRWGRSGQRAARAPGRQPWARRCWRSGSAPGRRRGGSPWLSATCWAWRRRRCCNLFWPAWRGRSRSRRRSWTWFRGPRRGRRWATGACRCRRRGPARRGRSGWRWRRNWAAAPRFPRRGPAPEPATRSGRREAPLPRESHQAGRPPSGVPRKRRARRNKPSPAGRGRCRRCRRPARSCPATGRSPGVWCSCPPRSRSLCRAWRAGSGPRGFPSWTDWSGRWPSWNRGRKWSRRPVRSSHWRWTSGSCF